MNGTMMYDDDGNICQNDVHEKISKKTFTKWMNKHLNKVGKEINDLFEDLRDGNNLISLLEVLSGKHIKRETGTMKIHKNRNCELALNFLSSEGLKLGSIKPQNIVDGNPKLILGLVYNIMKFYAVESSVKPDFVAGNKRSISAKNVILQWAQDTTDNYTDVCVVDFTKSWRDGLAFNAIIHRNRPDLIDWTQVKQQTASQRLENAFILAEKEYGIPRLLDIEDVDTSDPDKKSLFTYIASMYEVFPTQSAINEDSNNHKGQRNVIVLLIIVSIIIYFVKDMFSVS